MKDFGGMYRLLRETDRMFDEVRTGWCVDAGERAFGGASRIEAGGEAGSTLDRIELPEHR